MINNFKLFCESVNKNELMTFLLDFGIFISLNIAKSKDEALPEHKNDINDLLFNLRKPIINGMSYSEIMNDQKLLSNPKFLSAFLSQIRNFLIYIEPSMKKYISDDSRFKTIWLNKIEDFKERYKKIVS